ncbi:unnamed protein product [Protopolystoma xenopodis]|uniref:Uncharacterized protein n=1 Tax=Protopolystoma xenopodis TaxID=117903 RepID=A0A3S5CIM6_9PLAT|nr:unnamed protein product [Protopolystoma xenopodis]
MGLDLSLLSYKATSLELGIPSLLSSSGTSSTGTSPETFQTFSDPARGLEVGSEPFSSEASRAPGPISVSRAQDQTGKLCSSKDESELRRKWQKHLELPTALVDKVAVSSCPNFSSPPPTSQVLAQPRTSAAGLVAWSTAADQMSYIRSRWHHLLLTTPPDLLLAELLRAGQAARAGQSLTAEVPSQGSFRSTGLATGQPSPGAMPTGRSISTSTGPQSANQADPYSKHNVAGDSATRIKRGAGVKERGENETAREDCLLRLERDKATTQEGKSMSQDKERPSETAGGPVGETRKWRRSESWRGFKRAESIASLPGENNVEEREQSRMHRACMSESRSPNDAGLFVECPVSRPGACSYSLADVRTICSECHLCASLGLGSTSTISSVASMARPLVPAEEAKVSRTERETCAEGGGNTGPGVVARIEEQPLDLTVKMEEAIAVRKMGEDQPHRFIDRMVEALR